MRLELTLTQARQKEFRNHLACPRGGCQGGHFEDHQEVDKPLKETGHRIVSAYQLGHSRTHQTQKPSLWNIRGSVLFADTSRSSSCRGNSLEPDCRMGSSITCGFYSRWDE